MHCHLHDGVYLMDKVLRSPKDDVLFASHVTFPASTHVQHNWAILWSITSNSHCWKPVSGKENKAALDSPYWKFQDHRASGSFSLEMLNAEESQNLKPWKLSLMALILYGYFNHCLKEIELERTFLSTFTNKLSVFKEQLHYEMEISCYDQAIWLI